MTTDPDYFVSTDTALFDLDTIHGFLSTCYWSPGIPRGTVARAITHSLCFGVFLPATPRPTQVGFARIITDRATFAYLCDVFILDSHRRRGLCGLLMRTILAHPDLRGLRRICLMTRDAHGIYEQFGFRAMPDPSRYMELTRPAAELYGPPPA